MGVNLSFQILFHVLVLYLMSVGGSILVQAPELDVCGQNSTDGYSCFEATLSCYKVYTDNSDWDLARSTCVSDGGELAVINSEDENRLLISMYPEDELYRTHFQVFIGFYRTEMNDTWMTVQGETLAETGYTNWKTGEPNNLYGFQYCGTMYREGTFDDYFCTNSLAFVCERPCRSGSTNQDNSSGEEVTSASDILAEPIATERSEREQVATTKADNTSDGETLSETTESQSKNAEGCDVHMPTEIENGLMSTISWVLYHAHEHTADDFVQVNVSCNVPYRPFGNTRMLCKNGVWDTTEIAQCKLTCKLFPHPSVKYFCRSDPSSDERECDEFVPTGTTVRPQCNENYHSDDLQPMTCNQCYWDRMVICNPNPNDASTADTFEVKGQGTNVTVTVNDNFFVSVSGSDYALTVANETDEFMTISIPAKNNHKVKLSKPGKTSDIDDIDMSSGPKKAKSAVHRFRTNVNFKKHVKSPSLDFSKKFVVQRSRKQN